MKHKFGDHAHKYHTYHILFSDISSLVFKCILFIRILDCVTVMNFNTLQMPISSGTTKPKLSSIRWSHHIVLVLCLNQIQGIFGSPVFTFNPSIAQCKYFSRTYLFTPLFYDILFVLQ